MNKYFLLPFLLLGFMWSCSDSELITPGDEFQNTIESGTYTFELNGVFHDFSAVTNATSTEENSQIRGGNSASHTIVLTLLEVLSEGVFTEADGATLILNMGTTEGIFTNVDANNELLPLTISITNVNENLGLVTGIFSGTVYNALTSETRVITNGNFFQIQFEPEVISNRILKAKFNDQLFDFSTNAHAMGIQTAAVIKGVNTDQIQTFSITVPGGLSIGTLTEIDEVEYTVNMGTSNDPNDVYTNYNATDDTYLPVSLNITSVTDGENGRVMGLFTGTVTKFVNGVPTEEITITEGQINVPIVQ